MQHHSLEILRENSDQVLIRLDGNADSRYLRRSAIAELIDVAAAVHRGNSRDATAVGSTDLVALGNRLYEFLDGDEGWLGRIRSQSDGVALRIDADERLRRLPWELIAEHHSHLVVDVDRPLLPIRVVGTRTVERAPEPANRPLRLQLMVAAPQGVRPALDFEREEGMILDAMDGTGIELTIEESGTLEGLRFQTDSFGPGHFDVLHLIGHSDIHNGKPVFVVEDELGRPILAAPDDIARAIDGRWPRLVVVSGSRNRNTADHDGLTTMSEGLIRAGAAAVLTWPLAGDNSGELIAGFLYRQLGSGTPVDQAVAGVHRHLHADGHPIWHQLQLSTDRSPIAAPVTPFTTADRERSRHRRATPVALDPGGRILVAPRSDFVGRRRVIQRCLATLKAPPTGAHSHEGILLHGPEGLGKSTVTARLLERLPAHQRVVWSGPVDEFALRQQLAAIDHESAEAAREAHLILNHVAPLATRLRLLLSGPLATTPCLFVFDGFDRGNLQMQTDKTRACASEVERLLDGLLDAIRETASASRVIITSRYRFTMAGGSHLRAIALERLNQHDLRKKLRLLRSMRPSAATDQALRERAVATAAGNARLLELLDISLTNDGVDARAMVAAAEDTPITQRQKTVTGRLVETGGDDLRGLLTRINLIDLPVPAEAIHAICPGGQTWELIEQAVGLGLLDSAFDTDTGRPLHRVAQMLRPLLGSDLGEEEHRIACAAAAHSLNELWLGPMSDQHRRDNGPKQGPDDRSEQPAPSEQQRTGHDRSSSSV